VGRDEHVVKNGSTYRAADDTAPMRAPHAGDVVWRAYDRLTGAFVGLVVERIAIVAKHRAALIYGVPVESVSLVEDFRQPVGMVAPDRKGERK
jgi:hypothetical protein